MKSDFMLVAALAAAVVSGGCGDGELLVNAEPQLSEVTDEAPLFTPVGADSIVSDEYIVVFKPSVADVRSSVDSILNRAGGKLGFTYRHAIRGFSANFNSAALAAVRKNPNVAYVEQVVVTRKPAGMSAVPWNLDRIDQRDYPLDGVYGYVETGAGVNAYVIDTGIRRSHQQFEGRAQHAWAYDGGDSSDCYNHGTGVASVVGGKDFGVAKQVKLWAVRASDCSGNGVTSRLIAALDWVRVNRQSPAVVNIGWNMAIIEDHVI